MTVKNKQEQLVKNVMDNYSPTGWWIVQQPNGLFARFCHDTNAITHCQMSSSEVLALCKEYLVNTSDAEDILKAGKGDYDRRGKGGRWKHVVSRLNKQALKEVNESIQS